jgi:uncharacterized delta-60 repeat protein
MKNSNRPLCTLLACLQLLLAACGGGDGASNPPPPTQTLPPPPPPPPAGTVGTAGGTVTGPNSARVVIPANALAQNTVIVIEQSSAGAPPLPNNLSVAGQTYAFTPHGTSFAVPATMSVPFDPALVPPGATLHLYKTNAANTGWEEVAGATVNGNTISGPVSGFSYAVPVQIPPVTRTAAVHREWEMLFLPGDGATWPDDLEPAPGDASTGEQDGPEDLVRIADFGPSSFDTRTSWTFGPDKYPLDEMASGRVRASLNGVRYSVSAESPVATSSTAAVGGLTRYFQWQSFRKNSENATLSYTIIVASMRAFEMNPRDSMFEEAITAKVGLTVGAYQPQTDYFYLASGKAFLMGLRGRWLADAFTQSNSRRHFWRRGDFDGWESDQVVVETQVHTCDSGHGAEFSLRDNHRFVIDLSSVPVGAEFTVYSEADAEVVNHKGSPSLQDCQLAHGTAILADPLDVGGSDDVVFEYSGLTPTDNPTLELPPTIARVEPLVCDTPNAEAGSLQFEFSRYDELESAGAPQTISITRTGGSRGAVSATFSTSDGSAHAGVDYEAMTSTVYFDDGESGARVAPVKILGNHSADGTRTVLLRLSEPGGCATIGAQDTAELRIEDDDRVAPPRLFNVGGTLSGLVGSGLVIEDVRSGGTAAPTANGAFTFSIRTPDGDTYDARIRTQPTNPIQACRVVSNPTGTVEGTDVTNIEALCEPPANPSGALDTTFGEGGRATSTMIKPVAMRLQTDGKIVVVGEAGTGLMRFNTDGSADSSFGVDGWASFENDGLFRDTNDLVILNDGKIVVVGGAIDQQRRRMGVARFNPDGSVDTTFGTNGHVIAMPAALNINASPIAHAVHLLPDGKLLLAIGHGDDFAVVRLNADGSFDNTFGGDGLALASFGYRVEISTALAVQSDGKILLTGRVDEEDNVRVNVGLARFNADGSLDTTYGTNGIRMTDVQGSNNWDEGRDILALPDNRAAVAVFARHGNNFVMTLARFDANGVYEGATPTPVGPLSDTARALALQSDGKILMVGQVSSNTVNDFGIARYRADGTLDTTFGANGILTVDFFGSNDDGRDVLVQPDGRIVVGGFARNGSRTALGLVRINP